MKDIKIVDIDYIKTGDELSIFINDNDYTPNLSEYETRLRKDHQTIVDKLDEIKKAACVLINVGIFVGKDSTEDCVREITLLKDKVEKSLLEFMSILSDKQKSCDHEYRNIGHDSHYDYYMCDKCGSQDRW
jgi:hypothetical protein